MTVSEDVVSAVDGSIATVEIRRGPNNYFNPTVIRTLAEEFERLDADPSCRAIVLCSEGKNFCAGADFGGEMAGPHAAARLDDQAVRLFEVRTPIVAAVQGAAIGGGVGLALAADFRVATPTSRFAVNFAKLGFHQGFGISETLPAVVGGSRAAQLLYSGRNVLGDEAAEIGLCDALASAESLRDAACEFAAAFVQSAPLAVQSIKATLRRDLIARIRAVLPHELAEQTRLRRTADFAEGVRATGQRRTADFIGS